MHKTKAGRTKPKGGAAPRYDALAKSPDDIPFFLFKKKIFFIQK